MLMFSNSVREIQKKIHIFKKMFAFPKGYSHFKILFGSFKKMFQIQKMFTYWIFFHVSKFCSEFEKMFPFFKMVHRFKKMFPFLKTARVFQKLYESYKNVHKFEKWSCFKKYSFFKKMFAFGNKKCSDLPLSF